MTSQAEQQILLFVRGKGIFSYFRGEESLLWRHKTTQRAVDHWWNLGGSETNLEFGDANLETRHIINRIQK